jgi:hypothetical protein
MVPIQKRNIMKIKNIILAILLASFFAACQMTEFEENYTDPSKVSETSVEKQFSGFMLSNREYVLPSYWNYFVVLRTSLNRYNQATGWENAENNFVPGSSGIESRWGNYYNSLAQYRELEKVYAKLSPEAQKDYRIFMIAATTYLYDYTQSVVDLHGDIPWSKAGMLSTNGGDFSKSYPEYDSAEAIYTKMLDDLAKFSDELRTITLIPAIAAGFKTQDLVNRGSVPQWAKYVNSLRIRILTRVSGTTTLGGRADTELNTILSNPGNFPIVGSNADNVMFRIHTLGTLIDQNSFRTGLEDWNGNVAGKKIIDHMVGNADPRLTYLFQPGDNAKGQYLGLDPLMDQSAQAELIRGNTLTVYNRSTLSRNQFFPGVIINSAQVHFMASEYFLKKKQDTKAKEHYETGIKESIAYYQFLRSLSNDNSAGAPVVPTTASIDAYLANPMVSWSAATSDEGKMKLIAEQKWLHFNVVQPNENWAELRRTDAVSLTFLEDKSNDQKLPPSRWIYPGGEATYNTENYAKVQANDNLNKKIFWDLK